jgi:hypothetical protein
LLLVVGAEIKAEEVEAREGAIKVTESLILMKALVPKAIEIFEVRSVGLTFSIHLFQ